MSAISLRLPDGLLKDADEKAKSLHIPRAEYIRRAIEAMNQEVAERARRNRLMEISLRVRAESMRVNAEFDAIEHDLSA